MKKSILTVGIISVPSQDWGWAGLAATNSGLLAVCWNHRSEQEALAGLQMELPTSAVKLKVVTQPEPGTKIYLILQQAAQALLAFFSGDVKKVEKIPLDLYKATEWQKKVYQVVREIPPGQTLSYGEVAGLCGRPRGGRAVGQVMARNHLPIFIPCHRVIRGDGSLGNYGCGGSQIKERLLRLERLATTGVSLFSR